MEVGVEVVVPGLDRGYVILMMLFQISGDGLAVGQSTGQAVAAQVRPGQPKAKEGQSTAQYNTAQHSRAGQGSCRLAMDTLLSRAPAPPSQAPGDSCR